VLLVTSDDDIIYGGESQNHSRIFVNARNPKEHDPVIRLDLDLLIADSTSFIPGL
jgi:hypothetical protein